MKLDLPPIDAGERTPLVNALLAIIDAQLRRTALLEEIATLKGKQPRPTITPSQLETPPKPSPAQGAKRPGSQKRSKKDQIPQLAELIRPTAQELVAGKGAAATPTAIG